MKKAHIAIVFIIVFKRPSFLPGSTLLPLFDIRIISIALS
jgi:hypothetical protein